MNFTYFGVKYSEQKSVELNLLDGFLEKGWKAISFTYFVSDPSSMMVTIALPQS